MESEKYLEGQSMQRPPLFESDGFIYWKNRFETYVKSKDLDLWHIITDGDFPPIQNNPETKKDEIVPFHKQNDDLKKKLAKNNEAKMVIYNALPRKEYERIFMCQTAKEIWDTLLITHQGNNQVKANKIDLLVQQYEQFMIPEEESIDNAFAKFNTIITSLKALDEGFSSKNCVRKFLRALHPAMLSKRVTEGLESLLVSGDLDFVLGKDGAKERDIESMTVVEDVLRLPEVIGDASHLSGYSFSVHNNVIHPFAVLGSKTTNSLQSKIDQTSKISKSVFISNFPDDCSSRDLWKVCNGYGTVVDVFIPNKRSKAGKRFAFVRFINVLNLDRLIENLKTIWIGRFHLSANPARFERPKASTFQKEKPVPSGNVTGFKQSIVQNQGGPKESYSSILKPSLVLDDSCLVNRDLTNCVMGEVLQFSSINNLQVLLSNEGFHNTRVVYLGGLWVMIELKSSKSKSKFMEHVGVASWFRRLCNAQSDFAAKERIVWVDIEGVPLNAWTRSTFQKISSKWGELVELEDGYDDLFARKRICIKTSQTENILESFKLIVKGKVFWARAKELFVWSPSFKDVPEKELFSDDESAKINEQANNLNNDEVENASEVVSDTYFGDNGEVQGFEHQHGESNDKEVSSDPFNIYDLLDKRTKEVRTTDTSTSIPYPPGFTPANDIPACNNQDIPEAESAGQSG
ncbi:RNA-directed DNA polymerase, eukaryota [Tanacetum coccineum]